MILEERDGHQRQHDEDQRACGCEQGSFQETGARAGATRLKGRLVGEKNLRKQVREEHPLRNLARAAAARLRRGRLLELRGE